MSDLSANLLLPYLQPSQAQKHVTHNEALERLDVLTQLSLEAFDTATPPGAPVEGEAHGVGAGATGAWAGQDDRIAVWQGGAWVFITPVAGWRAWGRAEGALRVWDGSAWIVVASDLSGLDGVGIGTSWDATNRLAVASDAALFTHAGDDHRIKINKAAPADTATLLYQTGWSGRAEIGLAGNDDFSFKVSADGATWTEALLIDAATGTLTGAAVMQSATDTAAGRLARADYVYGPGNLLGTVSHSTGVPTGAAIERGNNANGEYVRFADGTQICTRQVTVATASAASIANYDFPAAFHNTATYCGASIHAAVAGGDLGARAELARHMLTHPLDNDWEMRAHGYSGGDIGNIEFMLVAIGRWF